MVSRRKFLQAASAITAGTGIGDWSKVFAQHSLKEKDPLDFKPLGNVSFVYPTDDHAQLKRVYFREPSKKLEVGEATGLPPHITGKDFLKTFKVKAGHSALVY